MDANSFKPSGSFTSTRNPLDNSVITNASHKSLLQNHNEAYTQLWMDNTRLQARYDMLWECYQSIVQRIQITSSSVSAVDVFDPNVFIPEVVPDSQPPSPYPSLIPLLKMKPSTSISNNPVDPVWEMFTRAYEDRRKRAYNSRGEIPIVELSNALAPAHLDSLLPLLPILTSIYL
ncbi:hypothetical protein CVT24_006823 [Panaeolus cyanescens]|uniref:Uncharacterized protein n=1 Tax=Panaeolus cyanescens TaxID=181874 RepID=A0A409YRX9_9AGAR|nr:hypothetical protein CVT24_006823 [Panaeolus cyanescens]